MEEEIWKPWPKNPKYLISNFGQVKGISGKILSCSPNSSGYPCAHVLNNGKGTMYVHRLVLETFKPIQNMENFTIDHINGNRLDNHLSNLEWVSIQENLERKQNNRDIINKKINQLIQKYGYEKTYLLIKDIN